MWVERVRDYLHSANNLRRWPRWVGIDQPRRPHPESLLLVCPPLRYGMFLCGALDILYQFVFDLFRALFVFVEFHELLPFLAAAVVW